MRRRIWLRIVMGMLSTLAMASPARAAPSQAPSGAPPVTSGELDSPYAARTAAEFVSACNSNQVGCDGKVADVLMSRQFSSTAHICLSGPSYADAVAPWLKAHPEMASMSAEDAIFLALKSIYKCGPPNNY
jgi:hypothetical protein